LHTDSPQVFYTKSASFDLTTPIGRVKAAFLIYSLVYTVSKEEPSNTSIKLEEYIRTVLRSTEEFDLTSFKSEKNDRAGDKKRHCGDDGNSDASSGDTNTSVEELMAHGYEVEPKTIETAQGTLLSRLYNVHHPFLYHYALY
jgi:hypothetical protein